MDTIHTKLTVLVETKDDSAAGPVRAIEDAVREILRNDPRVEWSMVSASTAPPGSHAGWGIVHPEPDLAVNAEILGRLIKVEESLIAFSLDMVRDSIGKPATLADVLQRLGVLEMLARSASAGSQARL
jgi:hypothetical protein